MAGTPKRRKKTPGKRARQKPNQLTAGRTRKDGKKSGAKSHERPRHAPGQLLGYSIQTTRMVARLLECKKGEAVSVEVFEDVAVTGKRNKTAEQVKSGLAHNPVADHSIDLWKTLFNWVGDIRSGALTTETKFVLYVAQPYEGSVIKRLAELHHPQDAHSLIAALRNEFWGPPPDRTERQTLPEGLAAYVNGVLGASDDVLCHLFAGFEYESGSGSPVDDLIPLLREKAIGEGAIEKVLDAILGWTKKTVEKLLTDRKPAIITWEAFNNQLTAAARKYDRSNLLTSTPIEITQSDVQRELQARLYVRQLRWIDTSDSDLVRAVNDYLRSSVDRTTWSERGDVLESSFEEFSQHLERRWDNTKRLVEIENAGRTETECGKALFHRCMLSTVPLQGLLVPNHFVPGSYHALADALTIGWHPRFRDLSMGPHQGANQANDGQKNVGDD